MLRSAMRWGAVSVAGSLLWSLALPGCGGDDPATNQGGATGEQGTALCQDNVDNDGDGTVDCADPGCAELGVCGAKVVLPDGGIGQFEETFSTCQDGKDNDGDGTVDCADPGCKALIVCGGTGDGGTGGKCACSDGLACTVDTCNPLTNACEFITKVGSCVIEDACYLDGAKNGTQCQVCDASKSQTAWTPIVGGCTIGGLCYRKGEKSVDGCTVCDPTRSVTNWSPVTGLMCTVGGRCYADGEKDTSGCEECKVAISTTSLQNAPSACSIGGQCQTEAQKHPSITCNSVSCSSAVSTSSWTISADECLINGQCHASGEKTANGCSQCIPSQSKTSWTSSSYACQIEGGCYTNQEAHPSPTCTSVKCDSTASKNTWTIGGNECLIGGVCRQAGDRTTNGCQECVPSVSKTGWTAVAGGCNIAGTCYASGSTHPSGTCGSVTCNPASSSSAWTIGGNECLIGNVCYAAGAKAPGSCQECNPSLSKTAWSPSATSCVIGGQCYANNTPHPSATCTGYGVSCDATKSTSAWSVTGTTGCVIGNQCYAAGALDPTGCSKCDPTISKTAWTPQGTCTNIIMAALGEGHQGNLGGIVGANTLCAQQALAAGYGGVWKAFLSSSTQNVKDLIIGTNATTLPVVNLQGQNLYASWAAVFQSTTWNAATSWLYAFNGKYVNEGQATPDWYDADGWHGSLPAGTVAATTCSEWTSTVGTGANGEWDFRQLLDTEADSCSQYLAVACVRIP